MFIAFLWIVHIALIVFLFLSIYWSVKAEAPIFLIGLLLQMVQMAILVTTVATEDVPIKYKCEKISTRIFVTTEDGREYTSSNIQDYNTWDKGYPGFLRISKNIFNKKSVEPVFHVKIPETDKNENTKTN